MSPSLQCANGFFNIKYCLLVFSMSILIFLMLNQINFTSLQPMKVIQESKIPTTSTAKTTEDSGTPIDLFPKPFILGNIPNFTYVLNRDICKREPVDLLLLIGSHPGNYDMRIVLRESWGKPREDRYIIKLMFPIGRPGDASLQQRMVDESAQFGDIVQGSFPDDYNGVTIRDLMSFHWAWTQCPQARFVMHIDDDMIMDIDHMLDALEEQMPKEKDYVACFSHFINGEVLRSGKYGLTKEEHANDVYDHYCSGWGYWLTPRAAKCLDEAALKHFPYRMNDAFLTGTLMTELGWKHLTLDLSVSGNPVDFQNYLNTTDSETPKYFMGYNDLNTTLTRLTHEKFRKYSVQNGIPKNHNAVSTFGDITTVS